MEKLHSGKKKTGLVVTVIVLLLLAILMLSVQIREITVTGNNKRYTDQQIIDLLFPGQRDRNTAYCYIKDRFRPHEPIPFVEDYKLVFNGLSQVEVIVYEKSVVGYVSYMSSYMYFDKDGIIVESANRRVDGIPWVTGLNFGHIALYQPLRIKSGIQPKKPEEPPEGTQATPAESKDPDKEGPVEPVINEQIFSEILNLTQILSIYELEVDKIQYNRYGDATLYLDDIEVIMGSNEGLNGKVAELSDMMPQLEGLAGTLYLDAYDETNTNAMYSFKPR